MTVLTNDTLLGVIPRQERKSPTMTVLTNDTLLDVAPAIFADTRYDGTSEKFTFVNTMNVIDMMRSEGFEPVRAKQVKPRKIDRHAFARHVVTFRLPDTGQTPVGGLVPEVILFNAHDGTSSYRLQAGIFRLVCENGLIVSDGVVNAIRIPHSRIQANDILESTQILVKSFPLVLDQINTWKATDLSHAQRLDFANEALTVRFGETHPVTPAQVLEPRRNGDTSSDLFTTMNVVQENLIRGGMDYWTEKGRKMRTRKLTAIDASARLNVKLWELATAFGYSLN